MHGIIGSRAAYIYIYIYVARTERKGIYRHICVYARHMCIYRAFANVYIGYIYMFSMFICLCLCILHAAYMQMGAN